MMSRLVVALLILASGVMADTRSEVDRLFMQASSGEVRYRDLVQPSKDSLIAMGDSAAKYLALKLNSTDARERHTLVEIFGGIGEAATPYLLAALDSDNDDQLRTTARALGEVKDPAAVEELMVLARHEDYRVRSEALTAVGKTGGDDALAAQVAQFVSDSITVVRKSCVAALGRIASPGSAAVLARALGDDYYGVRLTAYHGLIDFDSVAFSNVIELIEGAKPPLVKAQAIRLAGELKIVDALAAVERSLAATDAVTRGWAVWSWGRLKGEAAAAELRARMEQESDPFVRSQIAATLSYLSSSSADE